MLSDLLRFLHVLHLSSISEIHYWIMEWACSFAILNRTNSLLLVGKKKSTLSIIFMLVKTPHVIKSENRTKLNIINVKLA